LLGVSEAGHAYVFLPPTPPFTIPNTNPNNPGYREHRVLRVSFYIKLVFVVLEIILAIAFVSCTFTGHYNAGAVLEWIIAFIFSAYVFSFYVDLYPAAATKQNLEVSTGRSGGLKMRLARGRGGGPLPAGPGYAAGSEMEEGGSDRTLTAGSSGEPDEAGRSGRRDRRSGMASNF
jgi:hypothetical protein